MNCSKNKTFSQLSKVISDSYDRMTNTCEQDLAYSQNGTVNKQRKQQEQVKHCIVVSLLDAK